MSGLGAIRKEHNATNAKNEREYLNSVKFPFTYQNYNGVSFTIGSEEDNRTNYKMPWEIITDTEPYWSHRGLDEVEEVARSNSSVVYRYLAPRINKLGGADLVMEAI